MSRSQDFHLTVPELVYKEIERQIDQSRTSISMEEFLLKCVQIGLVLSKLSLKSNTKVLIQEDEQTREVDFYDFAAKTNAG